MIIMTDGTANVSMTCFSPQTEGLIKDINSHLEEVANKDPAIIPSQILALENTRHVFQFRFAKPAAKGPPTFILQKVMDDMPSILPEPTEAPSAPTPTSTNDLAVIEFTPPPVTPSTIQDAPANAPSVTQLPSSSTVRKSLFTSFVEQEDNPESKKQKTE